MSEFFPEEIPQAPGLPRTSLDAITSEGQEEQAASAYINANEYKRDPLPPAPDAARPGGPLNDPPFAPAYTKPQGEDANGAEVSPEDKKAREVEKNNQRIMGANNAKR